MNIFSWFKKSPKNITLFPFEMSAQQYTVYKTNMVKEPDELIIQVSVHGDIKENVVIKKWRRCGKIFNPDGTEIKPEPNLSI